MAGGVGGNSPESGSRTDLTTTNVPDRPRLPRGRFQSEIDSASARRKPRPNSYDEYGAKPPRRSRFESMVNLGVASSNASASDLMSRDSYDGSAVRQTLIVREDGKAPTQFVSNALLSFAWTGELTVCPCSNLETALGVASSAPCTER